MTVKHSARTQRHFIPKIPPCLLMLSPRLDLVLFPKEESKVPFKRKGGKCLRKPPKKECGESSLGFLPLAHTSVAEDAIQNTKKGSVFPLHSAHELEPSLHLIK